jgi:hypothetical protein
MLSSRTSYLTHKPFHHVGAEALLLGRVPLSALDVSIL